MRRDGFVAGRHAPCLRHYVEEQNFIWDRMEIQNLLQSIFSWDKFAPSRRMCKRFVLIAIDDERSSSLSVARERLVFCLNAQTDSRRVENVILQPIKCTPV